MKSRQEGLTQEAAAAKAGVSERSGRRMDKRQQRGASAAPRPWRTRVDPLAARWDSELVLLLESAPDLTGLSLLEHLDDRFPGQYSESLLRTLQRRVKVWRAAHGPDKAVIFRQALPPGLMGLSDFTHPDTAITIDGQPFEHLLYQYRLAYSGWRYVQVVLGGESYAALADGLQNAFARCGGYPLEHRTDSLSAAYKNHTEQAELTLAYEELCTHYGIRPSRNNVGVSHENGAIECANGSFKRRLDQALKRRGDTHFPTLRAYQAYIETVVERLNRRVHTRFTEEHLTLRALPSDRCADFTSLVVRVTRSSTLEVRRVTYTVPSRLIGERLRIHLYHDHLDAYLGPVRVLTLPRIYGVGSERARRIDYRHVIYSLAAKPQAFRYSNLRDDLLPNDTYRQLWTYVDAHWPPREACKWIVMVLRLAADYDCESALGAQLIEEMKQGRLSDLKKLQAQYLSSEAMPRVATAQHALADYDALLTELWPTALSMIDAEVGNE